MKSTSLIALLIAAAFAAPAFAQAPVAQGVNTPKIDQREANQQQRIANGVKSGELTAKETAHLEKGEAKIEADKQAAKADGKVTKEERTKLRHEQAHASRKIHSKKHNEKVAG